MRMMTKMYGRKMLWQGGHDDEYKSLVLMDLDCKRWLGGAVVENCRLRWQEVVGWATVTKHPPKPSSKKRERDVIRRTQWRWWIQISCDDGLGLQKVVRQSRYWELSTKMARGGWVGHYCETSIEAVVERERERWMVSLSQWFNFSFNCIWGAIWYQNCYRSKFLISLLYDKLEILKMLFLKGSFLSYLFNQYLFFILFMLISLIY